MEPDAGINEQKPNRWRSFNPFDAKTSKEEAAITLGFYIVGGLATLYFVDWVTVIFGMKESLAMGPGIQQAVLTLGTAFASFILGKKVSQNK